MHINDVSSSPIHRLSGIGSSPSRDPLSAQFTAPSPDFSSQQSNDLQANRFPSSQTTRSSNPPSISSSSTSNRQEEIHNLRSLLGLDDSSSSGLPSTYPDPRPPFTNFPSQQLNDLQANKFSSSQTMHGWNTPQAFFTGSLGVNTSYSDVIMSEGASSAPGPCIDQSKLASAPFIQEMSDGASTDKEPQQLADPNSIDEHPFQRGYEDDKIIKYSVEKDAYITYDEIGNKNIEATTSLKFQPYPSVVPLSNNINPGINSEIIAELIDKGYFATLIINNLIERARNNGRKLAYTSAEQQIYGAIRNNIYKDRLNNNNNIAKQNQFTALSNDINPGVNSKFIAESIDKGDSTILIIDNLIEKAQGNRVKLKRKSFKQQIYNATRNNIYRDRLNKNDNIGKQNQSAVLSNNINPGVNSKIIAELIDKGYSAILIINNLMERAQNNGIKLVHKRAEQHISNAIRNNIYKERLNRNNNIAKQNQSAILSNNINPGVYSKIIAESINKGDSTILIIENLVEKAQNNGVELKRTSAKQQIYNATRNNIYRDRLNNNDNIIKQR